MGRGPIRSQMMTPPTAYDLIIHANASGLKANIVESIKQLNNVSQLLFPLLEDH